MDKKVVLKVVEQQCIDSTGSTCWNLAENNCHSSSLCTLNILVLALLATLKILLKKLEFLCQAFRIFMNLASLLRLLILKS